MKKVLLLTILFSILILSVFVSAEEDYISEIEGYKTQYESGQITFPQFMTYFSYYLNEMSGTWGTFQQRGIELTSDDLKSLFGLTDEEVSVLQASLVTTSLASPTGEEIFETKLDQNYERMKEIQLKIEPQLTLDNLESLRSNQRVNEFLSEKESLFNNKKTSYTGSNKNWKFFYRKYNEGDYSSLNDIFYGHIFTFDNFKIVVYAMPSFSTGWSSVDGAIANLDYQINYQIMSLNAPVKYIDDNTEYSDFYCMDKIESLVNVRKKMQDDLDNGFAEWLLNDFADFSTQDLPEGEVISGKISGVMYEFFGLLGGLNEEIVNLGCSLVLDLAEFAYMEDEEVLLNGDELSERSWPQGFEQISISYTDLETNSFIELFEEELSYSQEELDNRRMNQPYFDSYWTTYYQFRTFPDKDMFLKIFIGAFKFNSGTMGSEDAFLINEIAEDYGGSFDGKIVLRDNGENILWENYLQITENRFEVSDISLGDTDVTLKLNFDRLWDLAEGFYLSDPSLHIDRYFNSNSWNQRAHYGTVEELRSDPDYLAFREAERAWMRNMFTSSFGFLFGDNVEIYPRLAIPKFTLTANKIYSLIIDNFNQNYPGGE